MVFVANYVNTLLNGGAIGNTLTNFNLATYAIDRPCHKTVWGYPQMGRLALSRNGILYIQGASQLTAINLK